MIGEIPTRLPNFQLPPGVSPDKLNNLVSTAVGMASPWWATPTTCSPTGAFAARGGYRIDSNQELLAIGVC